MFRHSSSLFVLGILASSALAQQAPIRPGRAYKVAVWYEINRPVESLQYRAYDVARGEYDEKAVDLWFDNIFHDHPDHGAYIRDINTEGQPGLTEADRLKTAIELERKRWADLQRQPPKTIPSFAADSMGRIGSRPSFESRTAFDRPAPGSPGVMANPSASPFPVPYHSGPR